MLASASAMAVFFAIGSVSAADQFTTLKGIKAVPMSATELSVVKGMDHHFFILVSPDNPNAITVQNGTINGQPNLITVLDPNSSDSAAPLAGSGRFSTDHINEENNDVSIPGNSSVAPSYLGLQNACTNGVIALPLFVPC